MEKKGTDIWNLDVKNQSQSALHTGGRNPEHVVLNLKCRWIKLIDV